MKYKLISPISASISKHKYLRGSSLFSAIDITALTID